MWAEMKAETGEITTHAGIPTLKELQTAVGGYVEAFEIDRDHATMWCNEESKLVVHPIPNGRATYLMLPENGGLGLFRGDYIAGDVAFTGPPDEEGATTTLSEESLAFIRQAKSVLPIMVAAEHRAWLDQQAKANA